MLCLREAINWYQGNIESRTLRGDYQLNFIADQGPRHLAFKQEVKKPRKKPRPPRALGRALPVAEKGFKQPSLTIERLGKSLGEKRI